MPRVYTCLSSNSPRSFLFCIVANVGPGGASRSLVVAYRQGRDGDSSPVSNARVAHVAADTLALAEFGEQVRRRLEEVPNSLGPSEVSGHILRIAYAGRTHLNWAAFRNLTLGLEGDEEDLDNLIAALAHCTALRQLCFLQTPDMDSDDTSARFCTQLLLRVRSSRDPECLRDKTIYLTSAFSTSLRNCSTTGVSFASSVVQVFPVMHILTFTDHPRKDVADGDADEDHLQQHPNSYRYTSYDRGSTLLGAERFAVRFLSYLRSVDSVLAAVVMDESSARALLSQVL
ncbi:hypothetical protein P170DRAFT_509564 [Aspergillus steynii IBT 23096]|uniref:Uncharacterized protein n=1 Tax=Aspergillus steynii IBT 23096 TaxID=1392250 RepID=A0A2I2G7P3_9EURO|nr:uncharacterized protein P170DRAFT_509564 [Aspergillus steynii IBT 23096]PLB48899.1 hypothetical protein P170DRAFT_509564 [Aspergillus steynii IBT 23096]